MDFFQIFSIGILLILAVRNEAIEISSSLPTKPTTIEFHSQEEDYRLPKTIEPISYDIELTPSLEGNFNFHGNIEILAKSKEDIHEIVLHAGRLHITFHEIRINGIVMPNSYVSHIYGTEKLSVYSPIIIRKNTEFKIRFEFDGKLSNDMKGFYKSSYLDNNNELKWLAGTQFGMTYAREAFPCFDEPEFKAVFKIAIIRKKNYKSLSNMPLVESIPLGEGLFRDEFKTTHKMSTYLVAFLISDLSPSGNENYQMWSRLNVMDQTKLASANVKQVMKYLEGKFDMNYPLSKLDMVAMPDFALGGMENWGLIVFRESKILYDLNKNSMIDERDAMSLLIHECSHMWFGNLVTPSWWNHVWLSEGFATYYEYMAELRQSTAWKMENEFLIEEQMTAYEADSLADSKPLTRSIVNKLGIDSMGDRITYSKGASIIRMMNKFLGHQNFDNAVKKYIKLRADNTVEPIHLWAAIQSELDSNELDWGDRVENIMKTWTDQPGFPVIMVYRDQFNNTISEQKRFLQKNSNYGLMKSTWWVPVTFATSRFPNFNPIESLIWTNEERHNLDYTLESNEFIIVNVQNSGFYRVNYDYDLWERIIQVLMDKKNFMIIHEINRASLIDDSLALARAGMLDYKIPFKILNYLKHEKEYLPFRVAFKALNYLTQKFIGHEEEQSYAKYMLWLIQNVQRDDKTVLSTELHRVACTFGDYVCRWNSIKELFRWKNSHENTIDKNRKPTTYCTAIKYGTDADWKFLWDVYLKENSPKEKEVILKALGCTLDKEIFKRYFSLALNKDLIRRPDSVKIFSSVYSSSLDGSEYFLDYLTTNFNQVLKYHDRQTIAQMLKEASQLYNTPKLVGKYKKFLSSYETQLSSVMPELSKSLNDAEDEIKWFRKHSPEITSTITKYSDQFESNKNLYRLPLKTFIPKKYFIHVKPSFESMTFYGEVTIVAEANKLTDTIILHAKELKNIKVEVNQQDSVIMIEDKYDLIKIALALPLSKGDVVKIKITYNGVLNNKNYGFYRSSYLSTSNKAYSVFPTSATHYLAATHFEPTGARMMFPCFDEPELKAHFELAVTVPKFYHAISNTDVRKIIPLEHGDKMYEFKETPLMSTYLLTLVVSDFTKLPYEWIFKPNYSVWGRMNAIKQAQYALSTIPKTVRVFENICGIEYGLPKLDLVALPDFNLGGMENWGLISFRETSLLYDNNHVSLHKKQSIANVIVHEIAHQWFGNLVTPSWWNDIWLSEGFARYFQYYASAKLNPDWSLESQFVVDQIHVALAADDSITTKAMGSSATTPAEINDKFDVITYSKGASVIRMLEKFVGSPNFYKALQSYLNARKYNNAIPGHLYEEIQKIVDPKKTTIEKFMHTWTQQAGYPVVKIDIKGNQVTFHQERFLMNSQSETSPNLWKIPITWISPNHPEYDGREQHFLLETIETIKSIETFDDCTIFNVEQGYYRVNYSPEHWMKIIQCLKHNDDSHFDIPEINRASLLDDLFNLGRAGHVNYDTVLKATQYLVKETSYTPWRAFFNGITYLRDRIYGRSMYEPFRRYVSALMETVYSKLGRIEKRKDSHTDKLLRENLFEWMCRFNHAACTSYSNSIWNDGKLTETPPIHLRKSVYCYLIRTKPKAFQLLWNWYEASNSAPEKSLILESLACSSNKSDIHSLLDKAIRKDHSKIRYHDSLKIFSFIYEYNLDAVGHVIDFIQTRHKDIYNFYGDYSEFQKILAQIAEKISTKDIFTKFKDMIEELKKEHTSLINFIKPLPKRVLSQLVWYNKNSINFHEWLELNYENNYLRLLDHFLPTHYDIHIKELSSNNNIFKGSVGISITVEKANRFLVLHADQLKIQKIMAYNVMENTDERPRNIPISNFKLYPKQQILIIYFKRQLKENERIRIIVEYSGILRDDMRGFYRKYYNNRWVAATNFKPAYARSAFPCFDEPAFKASFSLRIERPNDYESLANMPVVYSYPSINRGRTWDVYHQTEMMSTYLLAFVISDFKSLQPPQASIQIWGRSNIVSYGKSVLLQTRSAIERLEKYLSFANPLQKLNLVGIPDFHGEAMENWGLINFKENLLFHDDELLLKARGLHGNRVLVNKLVHTWFGNLVTSEWWNHIWLHEGIATYFQWMFENDESKFLNDFTVFELQNALITEDDSRRFNTPCTFNISVNDLKSINNVFNEVFSKKAASLIRMIHLSLGDDVFRKTLSSYLYKHQYQSTTPHDLWKEFSNKVKTEKTQQVSIQVIMDRWTKVEGYPIINVNHIQDDRIRISQQMYNSEEYHWIPITYATGKNPDFTKTIPEFWLGEFVVDLPLDANDWIVFNIQQVGYYRVNYDLHLWTKLIHALNQKNHNGIHVLNRAQIIDDFFNLARKGHIKDWKLIVEIIKYLKEEKQYLPWKSFFNGIQYLDQRFQGHKNHTILVEQTLSLIKSWNSTGSSENRSIVILHKEWGTKYQDKDMVQEVLLNFAILQHYPERELKSDVKLMTYCTAMKNQSHDGWQFLWNQYDICNSPTEKLIILKALGCTRNITILNWYLNYALSNKQYIRQEHLADIFHSIYSNDHEGTNYFLDWFKTKFYHVYRYYNDWKIVGDLALKFTHYISTEDQMLKWRSFVQMNSMDQNEIKDVMEQTTHNIDFTMNWFKNHSQTIIESFKEQTKPEINKPTNNSHRNKFNFLHIIISALAIIVFS